MDFGIFIPAQSDTWKLVKRVDPRDYLYRDASISD